MWRARALVRPDRVRFWLLTRRSTVRHHKQTIMKAAKMTTEA